MMSALQKDGPCHLTNRDGEVVEVRLTNEIINQALHIQEGKKQSSAMKLTPSKKKMVFSFVTNREQTKLTKRTKIVAIALVPSIVCLYANAI